MWDIPANRSKYFFKFNLLNITNVLPFVYFIRISHNNIMTRDKPPVTENIGGNDESIEKSLGKNFLVTFGIFKNTSSLIEQQSLIYEFSVRRISLLWNFSRFRFFSYNFEA